MPWKSRDNTLVFDTLGFYMCVCVCIYIFFMIAGRT